MDDEFISNLSIVIISNSEEQSIDDEVSFEEVGFYGFIRITGVGVRYNIAVC